MEEPVIYRRIYCRLKDPNPLFTKWIQEWRDEAEKMNSNCKYNLSEALDSLYKFPLPLESGRDCMILRGFGRTLCSMLDDKLKEYKRNNVLPSTGFHSSFSLSNLPAVPESPNKSEDNSKESDINNSSLSKNIIGKKSKKSNELTVTPSCSTPKAGTSKQVISNHLLENNKICNINNLSINNVSNAPISFHLPDLHIQNAEKGTKFKSMPNNNDRINELPYCSDASENSIQNCDRSSHTENSWKNRPRLSDMDDIAPIFMENNDSYKISNASLKSKKNVNEYQSNINNKNNKIYIIESSSDSDEKSNISFSKYKKLNSLLKPSPKRNKNRLDKTASKSKIFNNEALTNSDDNVNATDNLFITQNSTPQNEGSDTSMLSQIRNIATYNVKSSSDSDSLDKFKNLTFLRNSSKKYKANNGTSTDSDDREESDKTIRKINSITSEKRVVKRRSTIRNPTTVNKKVYDIDVSSDDELIKYKKSDISLIFDSQNNDFKHLIELPQVHKVADIFTKYMQNDAPKTKVEHCSDSGDVSDQSQKSTRCERNKNSPDGKNISKLLKSNVTINTNISPDSNYLTDDESAAYKKKYDSLQNSQDNCLRLSGIEEIPPVFVADDQITSNNTFLNHNISEKKNDKKINDLPGSSAIRNTNMKFSRQYLKHDEIYNIDSSSDSNNYPEKFMVSDSQKRANNKLEHLSDFEIEDITSIKDSETNNIDNSSDLGNNYVDSKYSKISSFQTNGKLKLYKLSEMQSKTTENFQNKTEQKIISSNTNEVTSFLDSENEHIYGLNSNEDNNNKKKKISPISNNLCNIELDVISNEKVRNNEPQKRGNSKDSKLYCPAYRSGPYAILVALYKSHTKNQLYLMKEELQIKAQPYCDKPFIVADKSIRYTAWSSISTLVSKALVSKAGKPLKYSITEDGIAVAQELLKKYVETNFEEENQIISLAESNSQMVLINKEKLSQKATKPTSKMAELEPAIFSPNSFEIILLVDTQETSGISKRAYDETIQVLSEINIQYEIRRLNVGDFAWICRDETKRELLLPYIVERKRMDDFGSSIRDGRFREQKFRLKQCGIQNLIYLIESYGRNEHTGLPLSSLLQAASNTSIQDDFILKFTNTHRDSMMYLAVLTRMLTENISNKTLVSCPKENLKRFNFNEDIIALIDFTEFQSSSKKTRKYNVQNMFIKHLLRIKGISMDKALGIVEKYPAPQDLYKAFKECTSTLGKELLSNIQYGPMKKKIGPAMSETLYHLFTSESYS